MPTCTGPRASVCLSAAEADMWQLVGGDVCSWASVLTTTDSDRRSTREVSRGPSSLDRVDGRHRRVDAATAHVPPQGVDRRAHPGRPGGGRRWRAADADAQSDDSGDVRRRGRSPVAVVVVPTVVQRPVAGPAAARLRAQGRQAVQRGLLAELRQRQRAEPSTGHVRVVRVSRSSSLPLFRQSFYDSTSRNRVINRVKWRHVFVVAIPSPSCGATPSYCA